MSRALEKETPAPGEVGTGAMPEGQSATKELHIPGRNASELQVGLVRYYMIDGEEKKPCGWPKHDRPALMQTASLSKALTSKFRWPCYAVSYAPTKHRLGKELLANAQALESIGGSVEMNLAIFDVDAPKEIKAIRTCRDEARTAGDKDLAEILHKEYVTRVAEWFEDVGRQQVETLLLDHPGLFVSRSEGGYRIWSILPKPFHISSQAGAAEWSRMTAAWANYLHRAYRIKADPLTDWQRIQRLPHDSREFGEPADLETIGDPNNVGFWEPELWNEDWPAITTPQAPRTPNGGVASESDYDERVLLHQLALNRGYRCDPTGQPHELDTTCPCHLEHTPYDGVTDYPGKTFLYTNGGRVGWINCFASHHMGKPPSFFLAAYSREEIRQAEEDLGWTGEPPEVEDAKHSLWPLAVAADKTLLADPVRYQAWAEEHHPDLARKIWHWREYVSQPAEPEERDYEQPEQPEYDELEPEPQSWEEDDVETEPIPTPSLEPEPAPKSTLPKGFALLDVSVDDTGKREWLVQDLLMLGQITGVIAAGGTGKSALSLHIALAVASGGKFAQWKATERRKVLIIASEDNFEEQKRRAYAAKVAMRIDAERVSGQILTLAANDTIGLISKDPEGKFKETALYNTIETMLRTKEFGLLVIDPFVEISSGTNENSNDDVTAVVWRLRRLARKYSVAIMLVHHARKGVSAGNQDSARGASSFVNMCRFSLNLEKMTDKEAKEMHVNAESRYKYVRIDTTKANYAPRGATRWLEIVPVDLASGEQAPGLQASDLGSRDVLGEWCADHRGEIMDLVLNKAPEGGWRASTNGRLVSRLDVALKNTFKVDNGKEIIAHCVAKGWLSKATATLPKGGTYEYWTVRDTSHEAPDF